MIFSTLQTVNQILTEVLLYEEVYNAGIGINHLCVSHDPISRNLIQFF